MRILQEVKVKSVEINKEDPLIFINGLLKPDGYTIRGKDLIFDSDFKFFEDELISIIK